MPSLHIHISLSKKYLNLPEDIVKKVSVFIDQGLIHDIGRRGFQRIPLRQLFSLPFLSPQDTSFSNFNYFKAIKLKAELKSIFTSEEGTLAFFFHHALDILALKIASAMVLDLYSNNICLTLTEGVISELEVIDLKLRDKDRRIMEIYDEPRVAKYREKLAKAIESSCRDEELISWIKEKLIPNYSRFKSLDYTIDSFRKKLHRYLKFKVKSPNVEVNDYIKSLELLLKNYDLLRQKLGLAVRELIIHAALYSGLNYALFIGPNRFDVVYEEWLKIGRGKSSIAKRILECYVSIRDNPNAIRLCVEREFTQPRSIFMLSHIPPNVLNKIKERFIQALEELVKYAEPLIVMYFKI